MPGHTSLPTTSPCAETVTSDSACSVSSNWRRTRTTRTRWPGTSGTGSSTRPTRPRRGGLDSAVVVGPFGRTVVGWSTAAVATGRLVVDALAAAVGRRPGVFGSDGPLGPGPPVRERDRRRLGEERIACRTSRRGKCRGDAPRETFFAATPPPPGAWRRRASSRPSRRSPTASAGARRPGRVRADARPNPPRKTVHNPWGTPTFCTAGSSKPIKTAMMATTTSSSISVNAGRLGTAALRGWSIQVSPSVRSSSD